MEWRWSDAIQTKGPVQAYRLQGAGGTGTEVLREAQGNAPGGEPVRCQAWIQREVETGEQEVPAASSSLRDVSCGRESNPGNGRGSHRTAPRRLKALLGSEQLAGAVQATSRSEDTERRSQSDISLLKR